MGCPEGVLGRLPVDVGVGFDGGDVRWGAVVVVVLGGGEGVVLVDGGFDEAAFGGVFEPLDGLVDGLGGLVVDGLVVVGPVGGGVDVGGAIVEGGGVLVFVGGGFGVWPTRVVTGGVPIAEVPVAPADDSSCPQKK